MIERPHASLRPHVILLGAGASRAAFPNSDKSSRPLPLMNDLVKILNIRSLVEQAIRIEDANFESVYSKLAAIPQYDEIRKEVELNVTDYFSSLQLPDEATIYDRILLSLRPEDAVFTFNWDPFLFDAYIRNSNVATLPGIFFLHGSVRIGICSTHTEQWGRKRMPCPVCGVPVKDVPLLYPVATKAYSFDPYIANSWECARAFLKDALVLTIFGYSAPRSDAAAVDLLKLAWMERSGRKMEHVEIIDIKSETKLYEQWSEFTPTGHFHRRQEFKDSWIARWPRRSREAVFVPMSSGTPCHDFPLTDTEDLTELQAEVREIAKWEAGDNWGTS